MADLHSEPCLALLCTPPRKVVVEGSRVTSALWGPFDQFLITGHEDGTLAQYDILHVSLERSLMGYQFSTHVILCLQLNHFSMYRASFQSDRRLHSVQEHKGLIADLQASSDQGMIITACKDTSAKVCWSCDHWSGSCDFCSGISDLV